MAEEKPKIRPLEVVPVQSGGRQGFLLRDPRGLAAQEVMVPADVAFLISQFDGTHTVREAQLSYVRRFGTLLTSDCIEQLLAQLEEALLLESPRFRARRSQLEAEFRAHPVRRATHAGKAYAEAAAAFVRDWEPLLEAASLPHDFTLDSQRPLLIAPHYDMRGAAEGYASAYKLLSGTERPDVVIILGIAHSGGETPFVLTRKAFETPFGALDSDRELIDHLAAAAPFDVFADEFLHRNEHSIEFQAVMLHFLYREVEPPAILPILCGSYHRRGPKVSSPQDSEAASTFMGALRDLLASDPRQVAVIASADLSHIGARFGDQGPLTQARLELSRRHDTALLERVQAGDAAGLYQLLAQEKDRYNVCGFPAMYALLRAASVTEGRLLSYRQAVDPQTQSCVSFASVGLR